MKTSLNILFIVLLSQLAISQSTTFDTIHYVSQNVDRVSSVTSFDVDGDSDFDVVSGSMGSPGIAWHENRGDTINWMEHTVISDFVDSLVYQIIHVDLDDDDDLDILASSPSYSGYNIFWYKNNGGGNFSSEQIIESDASGTLGIFAADFNGDTIPDVVAANEETGILSWYPNDGTGNFGSSIIICDTAFGATSVSAADIDNDDDMDLVAGYGHYVSWFRNDGDGVFYEGRIIADTIIDIRKVIVGDIDNDDDMDIVSASFIDNRINWYENLGFLNFNPEVREISALAVGALDVHVQDFDGDNDLDVVSASFMDGRVIWYQNVINMDMDEDFNRYVLTAVTSGASAVSSADIDNDGDLDIIAGASGNDNIYWLKNDFDYVFNWYYEACEGDTAFVINGEEYIATDTITDTLMSVHGRDSINVHYILFHQTPVHFVIEGPDLVTAGDTVVYRVTTTPNVMFMWDIENGVQVSYGAADTVAVKWNNSETGQGKITGLGYYPVTFCYTIEYLDVTIQPSGLGEHLSLTDVSVYPNPANDNLHINNFRKDFISTIYNAAGNIVMSSNESSIDVSNLNPGLYFVRIVDEKADLVKVTKVVIN